MASTGNVFPTVGANVDRAGNTAWTSPGNVTADDAANASATVPTDYLVCSGFGFAIPANAVILGVTVRVEASETGTGSSTYVPQLISSTTPTLIGAAKSAVTVNGTTPVISSNGNTTDRWGADLTPSIVNGAGFGVAIWSTDTTNTLSIDFVTIAIEYAVPDPRSVLPRQLGPFLPPRRAASSQQVVTSGQFSQSVGGTLSSSGALTRRTDRLLTAALASAGALLRQTGKVLTGTLTSAATLTGLRTVLVSLTGAIASSGALARQAQKEPSGALGSAGDLVRQAQKAIAGALSSDGALGTLFSGFAVIVSRLPTRLGPFLPPRRGTGSTQSATSAIQQVVGGTLTSSGTLTRRTDKIVTGTLALAGALVSQLAGALARRSRHPSQLGPFFTLFRRTRGTTTLTQQATFQQSLSGTVTSSGALKNRTDKTTSGAVAPTGSLIKRTSRALTGVIASSGTVASVRVILRAVTGAIDSAGTLARLPMKAVGGLVASSSTLVLRTGKTLVGAVTSSGVITKVIVLAVGRLSGVISAIGTLTTFIGTPPSIIGHRALGIARRILGIGSSESVKANTSHTDSIRGTGESDDG